MNALAQWRDEVEALLLLGLVDELTLAYFDPSQPRDPAGSPTGGQWSGGGATVAPERPHPTSGLTSKDWGPNLGERAAKFFGTTDTFQDAGYILPNGTMLDFGRGPSGAHRDHRDVELLLSQDARYRAHDTAREKGVPPQDAVMYDFMGRTGAARVNFMGIHALQMPTEAQVRPVVAAYRGGYRGGTLSLDGPRGQSITLNRPSVPQVMTWFAGAFNDRAAVERWKNLQQRDHYSPDEPRVPAGSADGGQWTSGGGGTATAEGRPPDTAALGKLSPFVERLKAPDGGFTYSPTTTAEPKTGYAVSPYPERSRVFTAEEFAQQPTKLVMQYVVQNWDVLQQPEHYLGGWHDPESGKIFLDISIVKATPEAATATALAHDQIAYFDLDKKQSVDVNRAAKSGQYGGTEMAKKPKPKLTLVAPTPEGIAALIKKLTGQEPDLATIREELAKLQPKV